MRAVFANLVALALLSCCESGFLNATTIQPIVTTTGNGVVQTMVTGNVLGPNVFGLDWNVNAFIDGPGPGTMQLILAATADTAGPVRPGFATYSVGTDLDSAIQGRFSIVASFDGISCGGPGCHQSSTGLVPFTLGVPFQLQIIANGSVSASPFSTGFGGGSIRLGLFEQDGFTPVAILQYVSEPGQFGLAAAALCALLSIAWKRALSIKTY